MGKRHKPVPSRGLIRTVDVDRDLLDGVAHPVAVSWQIPLCRAVEMLVIAGVSSLARDGSAVVPTRAGFVRLELARAVRDRVLASLAPPAIKV